MEIAMIFADKNLVDFMKKNDWCVVVTPENGGTAYDLRLAFRLSHLKGRKPSTEEIHRLNELLSSQIQVGHGINMPPSQSAGSSTS
jgi:hypothetical protein